MCLDFERVTVCPEVQMCSSVASVTVSICFWTVGLEGPSLMVKKKQP